MEQTHQLRVENTCTAHEPNYNYKTQRRRDEKVAQTALSLSLSRSHTPFALSSKPLKETKLNFKYCNNN